MVMALSSCSAFPSVHHVVEVLRERIGASRLEILEQQRNRVASRSVTGRELSASVEEKADRLTQALDSLDRGAAHASSDTYASLLRQCANAKALSQGKRLHAQIKRSRYGRERFLGNLLVHMYGVCGSLDDARLVFDGIPRPNVFSWNIMISAYTHNGHLDDARSMFDQIPQRNVASWNSMIAAYVQNSHGKDALKLFQQMNLDSVKPNKITFICILDACASLTALAHGKRIHTSIVESGFESDVVVGTALVQMYAKCGSLDDARSVFDKLPLRDVVSWNAMIGAYAQNGHGEEALELFIQMDHASVEPDNVTFICILDACTSLVSLAQGKRIHARIVDHGFESDVIVGNALVKMYGRCGSLNDARSVFDKMPRRNVISWTAMIAAYAQNGCGKEALELFRQMDEEGVKPDTITFVCVVDACTNLAALEHGKRIHARIVDEGFDSDVVLANALLNMYGKCGSLVTAREVFDKMPRRNVISWNAMIAAYAHNGHGREAFYLFEWMDLEGEKPDKITFISILSACSHAGLQDDGWCYFVSMSRNHGIMPTAEHWRCMVDLIGRAGHLDEAEDLINNMPFEPDAVAWMILLGACRIHNDVDRAECAAKQVFKLDAKNAAPYVLLSNIYAATGRRDDVTKVRKAMEDSGIKKYPGCSCIEVKDQIHEFVVGDTSHPAKVEIYAELRRLSRQMEEAGYMPDIKAVLHDVGDEEKEHMLCYHSEKLAIGFGLISTPAGAPLCIIKNLRVCSDCHTATKFISKIVGRKIIMRDANRFHHFEHAMCSCQDYW